MWQISRELYEHLQAHAQNLILGAEALRRREGNEIAAQHLDALEEELSFLTINLEKDRRVKS